MDTYITERNLVMQDIQLKPPSVFNYFFLMKLAGYIRDPSLSLKQVTDNLLPGGLVEQVMLQVSVCVHTRVRVHVCVRMQVCVHVFVIVCLF